jgi:peptide deformylase
MAIREIKKFPEPVLKTKAAPVTAFDEELQRLIDDMVETMYAAPGVGLAAPQVGVSKRLAVIDISSREEQYPLIVLINPSILKSEGEIEFEEGCLSIPEYTAKVTRAEQLIVSCIDREGKAVEIEAGGLLAIALQHGISPIKREFFKKRYKKIARAEK